MKIHNAITLFKFLDENGNFLLDCKKATGHITLDVKMHFTHKCRWSSNGHANPVLELEGSMHASVPSRKSARMSFKHASFNRTDEITTDIKNTCL